MDTGNVETDNNAVAFLDSATQNESRLDQEEAEVENEEKTKVFDDLVLKNLSNTTCSSSATTYRTTS